MERDEIGGGREGREKRGRGRGEASKVNEDVRQVRSFPAYPASPTPTHRHHTQSPPLWSSDDNTAPTLSSGESAMPFVLPMLSSRSTAVVLPFAQKKIAPFDVPQSCPLRYTRPSLARAKSFGTPTAFMAGVVHRSAAFFVDTSSVITLPWPTSARVIVFPSWLHRIPLKTAPASPVKNISGTALLVVSETRPITFRPTLLPLTVSSVVPRKCL